MLYYLNKFMVIVKEGRNYTFPELNIKEFTYSFNSSQEEKFQSLLNGEGLEDKEIINIFGNQIFIRWKSEAVILLQCINDKNPYSRNASYFWHMNMPNAIPVLSKKSVLILGCGGIGSHVAWNLAALGIGNVHIVDYDVIEASNLNRQILYDRNDIGKLKTEVLSKKLKSINPNINIVATNTQIQSAGKLNQIVCGCRPDCIVKALDSPIYISGWLDEVCEKNKIKYVSGILAGTKQMIGPTYLPDISSKYTDFFEISPFRDRIYGIGPSLSFVMYQISGELAEEVVKILLDHDNLQFLNKIVIKQNFTGEIEVLKKYKDLKEKKVENPSIVHMVHIIFILFIFYCCKSMNISFMVNLAACSCYLLTAPVFTTNDSAQACKQGFICLAVIFLCNIIHFLTSENAVLLLQSSALGILTIFFGIISIITLFICLYFIFAIWLKNIILRKVKVFK